MARLDRIVWTSLVCVACTAHADNLEDAKAAIRQRDYDTAAKALSADQSPSGLYLLATLHLNGLGVPADSSHARKLLESSAQRGEPRAAYLLSSLLANDEPRDLDAAQRWLKRAAELRYAPAVELQKLDRLPLSFRPQTDLPDAIARRDAFWRAAATNDVGTLQSLVGKDFVNAGDEFGRTALHRAAAAGAAQAIDWLLKEGATVDAQDNYGVTPLMLAATADAPASLDALLRANARAQAVDQGGNAPLAYAAHGNRLAQINSLLATKIDINAKNKNGWSALDYAQQADALQASEALRARGATASRHSTAAPSRGGSLQRPPPKAPDLYAGWSDLAIAVARDNDALIQEILARDTGNAQKSEYLLEIAAGTRSPTSVKALTAKSAPRNGGGESALTIAVRAGDVATVRALLTSGVNPDAHAKNEPAPLITALRFGHDDVVRDLLAANADQNVADGGTPALVIAAQHGQLESVQALLTVRANVDAGDGKGRTALWHAAGTGNDLIVSAVLNANASVDHADKAGVTALMQASARGQMTVVERLLRAGASSRAKSKRGDTAIMAAAGAGHADIVRRLIGAKPELDAQNQDGDTALIFASRAGHEAIVADLLQAGASSTLRNKEKIAAEEIARARGFERIAQLIDKH